MNDDVKRASLGYVMLCDITFFQNSAKCYVIELSDTEVMTADDGVFVKCLHTRCYATKYYVFYYVFLPFSPQCTLASDFYMELLHGPCTFWSVPADINQTHCPLLVCQILKKTQI